MTFGLNCMASQLRHVAGVVEEIEPPDLVGAVVGAVAGADTAVVGHVVQAFGAVLGRRDRADELAGRVLALLAPDGLHAYGASVDRFPE